jgi:hypothetical protein
MPRPRAAKSSRACRWSRSRADGAGGHRACDQGRHGHRSCLAGAARCRADASAWPEPRATRGPPALYRRGPHFRPPWPCRAPPPEGLARAHRSRHRGRGQGVAPAPCGGPALGPSCAARGRALAAGWFGWPVRVSNPSCHPLMALLRWA